jgi:putative transposase
MRQGLAISERRACGLVGLARTTLRREIKETAGNEELWVRIFDLAHTRRRFGHRRIHDLPRREGVWANHKRVYRLYRESALSVRKHRRRKQIMIDRQVLSMANGRAPRCSTELKW